MTKSNAMRKIVIAEPDCRGGASTEVVTRNAAQKRPTDDSFMAKVLSNLRHDANLIYLAARLKTYSDACDARMVLLRQAIVAGDGEQIAEVAHALTDATAKVGAIRMMKLCIALQMVGRRALIANARTLLHDLENEYARFKESLISAVG